MPTDDAQLLRDFARTGSGQAFAELVRRHIGLVYAAARRQVHDPQMADDVAQAVFIVLARKAGRVPGHILVGWLLKTARYAAQDALKLEHRRKQHEARAAQMAATRHVEQRESDWSDLEPVLDAAMGHLSDRARSIIGLRILEGKSLRDVGDAMGMSENAARVAVARALDKLREQLGRHGVALSAAGLGAILTAHATESAPAQVLAAAAGASAAGSGSMSALHLARRVINMVIWKKIRISAVACAASLLVALIVGPPLVGVIPGAVAQENPAPEPPPPTPAPAELRNVRGIWYMAPTLNTAGIGVHAVQFALFDEDPLPRFKQRLLQRRDQIRQDLAQEQDAAKRDARMVGHLSALWDAGFRQVTGDEVWMVTADRDLMLALSRLPGKKWLVTKMTRSVPDRAPICWCLPVALERGKQNLQLELNKANQLDWAPIVKQLAEDEAAQK